MDFTHLEGTNGPILCLSIFSYASWTLLLQEDYANITTFQHPTFVKRKLLMYKNCSNHFFFFPLPPPLLFPLSTKLPCVAPPAGPPFLRFPPFVGRFVLSLFFSHRSGSGGGVTPGTTPLGTREARTFFFSGAGCCRDGAVARTGWREGSDGGRASSRELVSDAGRVWRERRNLD